jgi:hypothetical protein
MILNPTHDTAAELDAYNDDALGLMNKQRTRAKVAALSLLGAALLALFAATIAMYARSPEKAPPFRTGTSR